MDGAPLGVLAEESTLPVVPVSLLLRNGSRVYRRQSRFHFSIVSAFWRASFLNSIHTYRTDATTYSIARTKNAVRWPEISFPPPMW